MYGPHDGRFAPSPTGELHLGNLRTALIAWLRARSMGGRFVLRIDDIDPDRSRASYERAQLADLAALGIDFDGEPVRQTDRRARYDASLQELAGGARTYPCFCSRAEVRAAASAPHASQIDGAYPGTCATLSAREAAARVTAGAPHCIRVRAEEAPISYDDLLLGRVEGPIDDFVVRRRDGVPAYNLASIIDEHDLGIGEVVRGADLADTTLRQLWLADALKLAPVPRFAHVALVLGPDGERLAKRHGSVCRTELAAAGVTDPALLAWLARSIGGAAAAIAEPRSAPDLLDGWSWPAQCGTQVTVDPAVLARPR